jgi:hypothetical protein
MAAENAPQFSQNCSTAFFTPECLLGVLCVLCGENFVWRVGQPLNGLEVGVGVPQPLWVVKGGVFGPAREVVNF